jgi:dTMP kinase
MGRGKYIVIEGGDGTGKTTQADILQKHLESQGKKVIHLKEPGGSPVSEAIRSVLLDGTLERTPMTNILLFTANRHELWHSTIKPALEQGTWVISTRNYWSTLAYQGYGEGMSAAIITAITATFTDKQYMNPDCAVMLTLDDINTS